MFTRSEMKVFIDKEREREMFTCSEMKVFIDKER